MRIQALKTVLDGNVFTKKGTVYEEDDLKARELIALGYAVHIPEPEESIAAPIKLEAPSPFGMLQAGGRDGLEKPVSLSQEDQAQRKRTYKKRAANAA